MGGDRIAGPKVILEPKKKKLLVVDLKKGYLGEDFGNTVPSIMGNVFFLFREYLLNNQDFMRCSFRHLILVKLSPCRICWANSCAQNELDLAKKQFDLCDEDGSGGCRTCRWKVMSNRGSRWLG